MKDIFIRKDQLSTRSKALLFGNNVSLEIGWCVCGNETVKLNAKIPASFLKTMVVYDKERSSHSFRVMRRDIEEIIEKHFKEILSEMLHMQIIGWDGFECCHD